MSSDVARGDRALTRRTLLIAVLLFSTGAAAATYLHWPALRSYEVYRSDIRQAPHWAAYHSTSFTADDMLLEYARYNESPLQNAIYYVGTYVVDMVDLTKVLAILSYGFGALLFFLVGRALYGTRAGVLAALFFTFLPDQFEFSAGFFSKFWMTPVILLGVYVLETKKWPLIIALMLFGSLAYPVSVVMLGAFVAMYMIFVAVEDRKSALPILTYLSVGSALALAVLLSKYLSPPDFIGSLLPGAQIHQMPEMIRGGFNTSPYVPIPSVWSQVWRLLGHPFVLGSAALYAVVLRKKLHWDTTWTALLVAGVLCYAAADDFFMRLYIPNRYTRHSVAVVLILWNARNLDALLGRVPRRWLRYALLIAVLGTGGYMHRDTFEQGEDTTDRRRYRQLNEFIRGLPDGALIAGPPRYMDDVPIQGRHSVLVNFKLSHPWWDEYYPEVKERTIATFEALYATDTTAINRLYHEYGVSHFVVGQSYFGEQAIARGRIYVNPYNQVINRLTATEADFILERPPAASLVYDEGAYAVVELPLR